MIANLAKERASDLPQDTKKAFHERIKTPYSHQISDSIRWSCHWCGGGLNDEHHKEQPFPGRFIILI